MYVLDPTWFFLLAPSLALAFWARRRVRRASARATSTSWTGASLAAAIAGEGAIVTRVDGPLPDLFDPTQRLVRLSSATFDGTSLDALAIAAREAGQARWGERSAWSRLRLNVVVLLRFAVMASWLVVLAGFLWVDHALVLDGSAMMGLTALFGVAAGTLELRGVRAAAAALTELDAFPPDELASLLDRLHRERLRPLAAAISGIR